MITAIVLVHIAADRIGEAAQAITDLDSVAEVYSCAGDVDLIAVVRVAEHEQLADVIAGGCPRSTGCCAPTPTSRSAPTPGATPMPPSPSASTRGADGRAPIHMGGTTRKRWFWDFQGAEARGRGARR